jgi:hypothetical protein
MKTSVTEKRCPIIFMSDYNMGISFSASEFVIRFAKYALEGIVVAIAMFFMSDFTPQIEQLLIVGLTAACTFSLLDFFAPSIGSSARTGAGFGLGANLVGFPR